MMEGVVLFLCFILIFNLETVHGIYCYQCVSSEPGCGEHFYPSTQWSSRCPNPQDVCVKIIETKYAETLITRDCLSNVMTMRRDVPADHYEGCRQSASDPKLAVYVTNSLQEVDVKRDHYDRVEFCMCSFDEECNSSSFLHTSPLVLMASSALAMLSCYIF